MPLANVSESENEYLITIELPDVKKEDLKIAIADGIITIPVLPYRVNSWKLRHGIGMRCASGSSAC
jgi:HSP20 family molecular chaperone IbpA